MARWDYNQRESLRRTQFWVSGVCNNDCVFCLDDLWKPGRAPNDRPQLVIGLDRLDAFLDARERSNEVCITGPDPGTCRDLPAIVARVRELGFERVAIMTNGRTLGARRKEGTSDAGGTIADQLAQAGVTRFELSIHGGEAAVHDGATRKPGSFEQARRGLHAALAARNRGGDLQVEVVTVAYRDNLDALEATVGSLLACGPDRVSVNVVEPWGEALARFDDVVPPLPRSAAALAALLRRYGATARLTVDGVPPCLLPAFEGFAGNREAIDLAAASGDAYASEESDQGRAFAPGCADCLHRPVCNGVYRAQAERGALDALRPVRLREGEPASEAERRGLLALFYDRWEKRYRAHRQQVERAHVDALSRALPPGVAVTLTGTDPLGARVQVAGLPCRLRVTSDAAVPARHRVGPFVLIVDDTSQASLLDQRLARV